MDTRNELENKIEELGREVFDLKKQNNELRIIIEEIDDQGNARAHTNTQYLTKMIKENFLESQQIK